MKRAAVSLFLLGASVFCFAAVRTSAQSTESKPSSDPVEISKIRCSQQSGGMNVQSGWNGMGIPQSSGSEKWQVEYRIKCQIDKQVSVIYWSFRFVNKDKKEIVEEFKTKRSVKPGKEVTVSESFGYDARLVPQNLEGNVLIRKIEFQDGSSWEPPPIKSDSMLTGPQQ